MLCKAVLPALVDFVGVGGCVGAGVAVGKGVSVGVAMVVGALVVAVFVEDEVLLFALAKAAIATMIKTIIAITSKGRCFFGGRGGGIIGGC